MLDPETYLRQKGEICPVCKRSEVVSGEATLNDKMAIRQMECRHCRSTWAGTYDQITPNFYVLVGYEGVCDNTEQRETAVSKLAENIEELEVDPQFKMRMKNLLFGTRTRGYLFGKEVDLPTELELTWGNDTRAPDRKDLR